MAAVVAVLVTAVNVVNVVIVLAVVIAVKATVDVRVVTVMAAELIWRDVDDDVGEDRLTTTPQDLVLHRLFMHSIGRDGIEIE